MESKSDLSKKYIAEALIILMKKKKYTSITNKDITDKAGLSHITIYRNFKNKDEILRYYLNDIFEKWKVEWNDQNNIAYNIFTFFQKNKNILFVCIASSNLCFVFCFVNRNHFFLNHKSQNNNNRVLKGIKCFQLTV